MAGRIPQNFIDELLNRIDIVDVVGDRVPLKKAGREHQACCPFHNEKTPSFTVSPGKQFYHCFGCGAHGSAISFLMEYDHLEFPEAIEELARSAGIEVPREEGHQPRTVRDDTGDLYALSERVAEFYRRQLREHSLSSKAVDYLKERGLSGEIAARYGIGYAPPGWDLLSKFFNTDQQAIKNATQLGLLIPRDDGGHYDRFRDRIMFPIRDRRGRTIGFGGRVFGDEKPKYMNSPESEIFHKGQELYGLFEARKQTQRLEKLLVVEGYMDVVALAQFDINNTVATLGTATTSEHLERIFRTVHEVVFCFDGDRAGKQAAWRALETVLPVLRDGREARFLFVPDGEDPDSLVRKEGSQAFMDRTVDSVPLSEFLYRELSSQVDTQSMDGRARMIELARPLLSKLPDGIFHDMMLEELATRSGLAADQLRRRLEREEKPEIKKTSTPSPGGHSRSPIRVCIRLLLEEPQLGQLVQGPAGIEDLDAPGIPLLMELLELLRDRPQINTGGILEHWRDRPDGKHLARLLSQPLEASLNDINAEFEGLIRVLREQRTKQRTEFLQEKSKLHDLEKLEIIELNQLLISGRSNDT